MDTKIKTTTRVKLTFDLQELKVLYDKLVVYCNYNPKIHEGINSKTGKKYMATRGVDEVEAFLINLHEIFMICDE